MSGSEIWVKTKLESLHLKISDMLIYIFIWNSNIKIYDNNISMITVSAIKNSNEFERKTIELLQKKM